MSFKVHTSAMPDEPGTNSDHDGRYMPRNELGGAYAPLIHATRHESGGADPVNHDNLTGFVLLEHVNHGSVDIIAGSGLTGGGDISADRTLNVGAGLGIAVNANDIQLKNAGALTDDFIPVWDDANGQFVDSPARLSGINIGIGVTPSYKLEVDGDIALRTDDKLIANVGGDARKAYLELRDQTTGDLFIQASDAGGTDRDIRTQESGGRFGIGVDPSYKLDVNSGTVNGVARFASSDDIADIRIEDDDTIGYFGVQDNYANFGGSVGLNADNLNISTTTGDVAIGTTTATDKLTVIGTGLIGSVANYSHFESDGTLEFNGAATVYDDIFTGFAYARVPASNAPNWTTFKTANKQYTFDIDDLLQLGSVEVSHKYKEGSDVEFHIHWATNGVDITDRDVEWEIVYTYANSDHGINSGVGDAFSAESTISAVTTIPANTPDRTNMYTYVGTLSDASLEYGAKIIMRVRRIDTNIVNASPSGDPFGLEVGIHIECDTIGSRTLTSK